ncbi:MAG: hypothetical protein LBB04_00470 [Oscillospiraceae bacterium]|jgi:hypothetical protein|nr:hypothetical protein [Oscillospiraceae bacterium]
MYAYHKPKKSILGIVLGLLVFAEMSVPTHAGPFDCCSCCDEEFTKEELMEKIAEVNRHFGSCKMTIERAREICPRAVKSELERRFMAYREKLEIYLLTDVAHFYVLHAHSILDLDKHCVYFICGPARYEYQEVPPDFYEIIPNSPRVNLSSTSLLPNLSEPAPESLAPVLNSLSLSNSLSTCSVYHSPTSYAVTENDKQVSSPRGSQSKSFVSSSSSLSSHSYLPPASLSTEVSPIPLSRATSPAPSSLIPQQEREMYSQELSRTVRSDSTHQDLFTQLLKPRTPSASPGSSPNPVTPTTTTSNPTIRIKMKSRDHQKINLDGFTWNPPFGNFNPLEGLIILCGDTDLINKTCNGNLESSSWGPVGPSGLIYTEYNHTWVRPGDLVTTAGKAAKMAEKMRKKLAKTFNFENLISSGGKVALNVI